MKLTPEQMKLAHDLTVTEVPVAELLQAIHEHSRTLEAWFESPGPAIVHPDRKQARLNDFQRPLTSWVRIYDILGEAEERAEKAVRAMADAKTNGAVQ